MIVVGGGIKGGSGKPTVATPWAILSANTGKDVWLIAADDQESATDLTILRHECREGGRTYSFRYYWNPTLSKMT